MERIDTPLQDVIVLSPSVFKDDRGWFTEVYNTSVLSGYGITDRFEQDNHSFSHQGVLRGLHFQVPPMAQAKLVRCVSGALWDVAVDLRKDSPSYLQWYGMELSAENKLIMYIPVGFAHGFYALQDCEMIYKCSQVYSPEHDGGIAWNDADFAINWPLVGEPTLSDKDSQLPRLADVQLQF